MKNTAGIPASSGALLPLWDDSHMYLWLAIFIASTIGLIIYCIWVWKSRKHRKNCGS